MKTTLNPSVLRWARTRAAMSEPELAEKLGFNNPAQISEWERTGEITFSKAALLSERTHTPIGFLFLQAPPREALPIKDFRRIGGVASAVTPDLLDVIYDAQRRQAWFREYLIESGSNPLSFVGKFNIDTMPQAAAAEISETLKIGHALSTQSSDWKAGLSAHINAIDEAGIIVMRSGVVGNSPNRRLMVEDFRGFALCDAYAPIVFINSQDSTAAQLFTLAHEVVHICIGESAVFNLENSYANGQKIEEFCNAVAAEILLPIREMARNWRASDDPHLEVKRLSKAYKVSTLVVARRAHDAAFITKGQFNTIYAEEVVRFKRKKRKGGHFHNTMNARVSGRIVNAVVSSTIEGKTLYTEAMNLLGVKSATVISNLAKKLGYSM